MDLIGLATTRVSHLFPGSQHLSKHTSGPQKAREEDPKPASNKPGEAACSVAFRLKWVISACLWGFQVPRSSCQMERSPRRGERRQRRRSGLWPRRCRRRSHEVLKVVLLRLRRGLERPPVKIQEALFSGTFDDQALNAAKHRLDLGFHVGSSSPTCGSSLRVISALGLYGKAEQNRVFGARFGDLLLDFVVLFLLSLLPWFHMLCPFIRL